MQTPAAWNRRQPAPGVCPFPDPRIGQPGQTKITASRVRSKSLWRCSDTRSGSVCLLRDSLMQSASEKVRDRGLKRGDPKNVSSAGSPGREGLGVALRQSGVCLRLPSTLRRGVANRSRRRPALFITAVGNGKHQTIVNPEAKHKASGLAQDPTPGSFSYVASCQPVSLRYPMGVFHQ